MIIELVDRSQLSNVQDLKNQYEWLLELNDDELSQRVIDTNDVQNALIELLRFVDEVLELPVVSKPKIQVNDTVYVVTKYGCSNEEVIECRVVKMSYKSKFVFSVKGKYDNGNFYNANFTESSIGKNVFLNRNEAEIAKERMLLWG